MSNIHTIHAQLEEKRDRLSIQLTLLATQLSFTREMIDHIDSILGLMAVTPVAEAKKPTKPAAPPQPAVAPKRAPRKKTVHKPTSPYMLAAADRVANVLESEGPQMYGTLAKKAFPDKSASYVGLAIKGQPQWFHQPGGPGTAWELTTAGRNRPKELIRMTTQPDPVVTSADLPQEMVAS